VEPGLVERKVWSRSDDEVVVWEVWDLTVPHCPIIQTAGLRSIERWSRSLRFTPQEFDALNMKLTDSTKRGARLCTKFK
jgi:hypothetical protein